MLTWRDELTPWRAGFECNRIHACVMLPEGLRLARGLLAAVGAEKRGGETTRGENYHVLAKEGKLLGAAEAWPEV